MSAPTHSPAPVRSSDLRLPRWVIAWFVITAAIQTYDACYVLLGSVSHKGGSMA